MLSGPYRERLTQMIGVRTVSDWQLKVYTICGEANIVEDQVVEAALHFAANNVDWPVDSPAKLGFLTLNAGEEAMWLLVDLWMEDILHHFLFRAPCNAPEAFGPGPGDGTMACVWELAVIMHERKSWIKHALTTPDQPDYTSYLNNALAIRPAETC